MSSLARAGEVLKSCAEAAGRFVVVGSGACPGTGEAGGAPSQSSPLGDRFRPRPPYALARAGLYAEEK